MKFKLSTTHSDWGLLYSDDSIHRLEQIGFKIKNNKIVGPIDIEIMGLEDLVKLLELVDPSSIILSTDPPEIEIYDDYRE